MFWVSIVMRLLFWGAFGLLISIVVQRGVGRTVEDLRVWGTEIGNVVCSSSFEGVERVG